MKECRIKLGYSAEQVAAFLNVSPATVYRYENGDIGKLPANLLAPLANYLCTTPAYLMGWDDHPDPTPDQSVQSVPIKDEDILSFLGQCVSDPRFEVFMRVASKTKPDNVEQATRILKALNGDD